MLMPVFFFVSPSRVLDISLYSARCSLQIFGTLTKKDSDMDVKAMARSKRAHTQHHQPRKPRHSKPPSTARTVASSSSNDPNTAKKETRERKRDSDGSSLPSNWDRYADPEVGEDDVGMERLGLGGGAATAKTDSVKPKSKGADYSFLVSQAKSQPAAASSVSLDDVLPDYCQGLESLLSVRGENILSWTGGDSFLVEDELTTSIEAPFLSLNLQKLAEDLSKLDLTKRLFIDADLLPPEMRAMDTRESNSQMAPLPHEKEDVAIIEISDSSAYQNFSERERSAYPGSQDQSACALKDTHPTTSYSVEETESAYLMAVQKPDKLQGSDSKQSTGANDDAAEVNKERMPRFEAAAAEADLDMLLNSFSETKFLDGDSSSVDMKIQSLSVISEDAFKLSAVSGPVRSSVSATNVDNEIDDLLNETSNLGDPYDSISQSLEVNTLLPVDKVLASSSSLHSGAKKSKVMEDFDSWLDTT